MAAPKSTKVPKTVKRELILSKVIANFLGKDERVLVFRKEKNKTYAFVINSSDLIKIDTKKIPESVQLKPNDNLGMFLQKLCAKTA